ncbi:MAG: ferritin family protein [Anaerolineae bacterium]|nr:ferritin family protein [Anaerolineae bacterium]
MKPDEVLVDAMKSALEGRDFYLDAAEKSSDPKTAEVYRTLADDQLTLYNHINRQCEALGKGKCVSPMSEQDIADIESVNLVFPAGKEALEELPPDADEEDALLYALSVEDKFFRIYKQGAESSADADTQQMFLQLAAVKQRHFETLMQRYTSRFDYPR